MKFISVLLVVIIKIYGYIKGHSPWAKAKVLLAFYKYTQTSTFRERVQVGGKEYAKEIFINTSVEWKFFMEKFSWKEKLGIFFGPYTYTSGIYKPTI